MNKKLVEHEITDEVIQAATANPNGWVYKIDGVFGPDEGVPPEAVVGAWKVDPSGNLTGEFIVNPNYKVKPSATVAEQAAVAARFVDEETRALDMLAAEQLQAKK